MMTTPVVADDNWTHSAPCASSGVQSFATARQAFVGAANYVRDNLLKQSDWHLQPGYVGTVIVPRLLEEWKDQAVPGRKECEREFIILNEFLDLYVGTSTVASRTSLLAEWTWGLLDWVTNQSNYDKNATDIDKAKADALKNANATYAAAINRIAAKMVLCPLGNYTSMGSLDAAPVCGTCRSGEYLYDITTCRSCDSEKYYMKDMYSCDFCDDSKGYYLTDTLECKLCSGWLDAELKCQLCPEYNGFRGIARPGSKSETDCYIMGNGTALFEDSRGYYGYESQTECHIKKPE